MKGRTKLPEAQKKERLIVFIEKEKLDKLGSAKCVELSRESIDKEFKKQSKP